MILNDKVYLGDTLLDLGEANGVTLEYSISDPADMAAIFTPGSWTVNLPKSAVNLQAFGFMTEPGSTTDAPHKEHPCMVIRNGVPLFDSGKLTVIDVTDTINVVITWNTNERLTELSGRKLRDLAITKVMRWDPATFETSEDNDFKWVAETGYKQAGADGIMNYNARGFRPAVKASYLLAALLPGLTIGQTYWNRLENVWLMLPTTNGNDTIDAALTYRGYGAYSNYDPVLNVRDVMRNFKQYGTISATYDLLINQSSPSNPFSGLYIPKDGRYRIFGYIRTSSSAGGSELYNGKFRLMLNLSYDRDENGALVENYENLYYSEYPINSNNVFDVTVDLQAGDVVTIFNSYQLTNATISGDIAIDLNEVATENTDTGYLLDYPIRENLPDVGCIEFITALFSMVALQAQTSGTAVKVFSIDDVIGATDAIDISPYINDRDSRQLEYSHGLTADNVLSYVDETDAIHFAANTYNKTVNKVVELPFASGRDMALYRRDEDGRFEFVGEDTAMALARSGTASIRVVNDHISDSATRTVTVSVFGFGGLDWATLYGTYWQGYKGVFADNQRVVKYNAVIPESFVRTLDFSKPVHDGVNRYLLMKVSEYTYTGACTLMMALLDGVEVAGGPLENVILADVAVPLLFNVNVEALYNPSLVGTGKLIRELTETVGALPAGAEIAVDLGTGEAKKWKPTFHDHSNKAFLDLIDQGLSKTSDVVHNSVICPGPVVAGALNGIAPDDLPVATGLLYGVVKLDDVTIKLNTLTGKIYAVASGGTSVSWGTEVAGQTVELNVGSVIKSLALAGHTHSQYLTAITKAMVEAVLTGIITSHQHNYLPINGGNLTGPLTILTHTAWHAGNDGTGSGLDADLLDGLQKDAYMRYEGWINNPGYNANTMAGNTMGFTYANNAPYVGPIINIESGGYNLEINAQYNNDSLIAYRVKNADSGTWNTWRSFYNSANANSKTIDWNAKDLKCVNTIADGAVVAGALNGTPPDDLPVATSSLFGVIKTGLSLRNNAGVVNLNGRHYTTTTVYTDSAVREITAEIALGTGSMANGTLDQIQLSFAPLTTTRGLTANVIATDTGAGMGLKLSFRKDAGTGRWYIMIYNDSGASVTRDGILLSIRGQQTI